MVEADGDPWTRTEPRTPREQGAVKVSPLARPPEPPSLASYPVSSMLHLGGAAPSRPPTPASGWGSHVQHPNHPLEQDRRIRSMADHCTPLRGHTRCPGSPPYDPDQPLGPWAGGSWELPPAESWGAFDRNERGVWGRRSVQGGNGRVCPGRRAPRGVKARSPLSTNPPLCLRRTTRQCVIDQGLPTNARASWVRQHGWSSETFTIRADRGGGFPSPRGGQGAATVT